MPQSKEQKTITNIYALFTVSLCMTFLPMMTAAVLAFLMFTGTWIAAYVLRKKHGEDSLISNHMTYIIRTMWITALFGSITTTIACVYILGVYDPSAINACAQSILGTGGQDMAAMEAAVQPCMDEFLATNMAVFMKGTMIAGAPLVIYLGFRLTKGVTRAVKGHRLGNIKSWF